MLQMEYENVLACGSLLTYLYAVLYNKDWLVIANEQVLPEWVIAKKHTRIE